MSKVKIGLVGCGAWAREAHLPFLLSQDDVELVGIVDIAAESRREELQSKYHPRIVTTSITDLLKSDRVDAMVVSTPHATHFEIAEALVSRGIHVHIDKPLCSTLIQVDELITHAATSSALLSTHTQRKYMPGQSQLKSYLQKYFSEIYHVSGSIWQPLFDDYAGSWRADKTLAAGGILMDSGYHVVDTIVSLLGSQPSTQIRDIAALAHNANNPNDAFVTLVFRIDRAVVQVNAFRGTPKALKKEEYQVLGDGGHISLKYTGSGRQKTCQTVFWAADGQTRETEDLTLTSSYTFHPLQLFLDAIRGNHVAREAMQDNIAVARTTLYILHEAYSRDI